MDQELREQLSYLNSKDIQSIESAYLLAKFAHLNQNRYSGQPYLSHCVESAKLLAQLKLDAQTIIAGLLHDVPEDTKIKLEQIEKQFGKNIASLVDGVTKLSTVRLNPYWLGIFGPKRKQELPQFERQVETLRKMFLAMSKDVRVVIIKLADRLDNMRTLQYINQNKQVRIAQETLEIYAPIADRLGIGIWKGELEDLSFFYVYPEESTLVEKIAGKVLRQRTREVEKAKKSLLKLISRSDIEIIDLHGRIKHRYSLWKKLIKYNFDIKKIYDLVALRIIVDSEINCYRLLELIHQHFKPLPGRVKDYIALPKSNGYRSLHSTVYGPSRHIIEIQIRTVKMHNEAEQGIASHWQYKEPTRKIFVWNRKETKIPKQQIRWIEELAKWQKSIKDPHDFKEALTLDFFKDRIFVFTPNGDVKDLPKDSTPIDFAYSVHSEIGDHCSGAKINGKMVSLNYQLKSGDVVEIITSTKSKGPKQDWLGLVRSHLARSRVKKWLTKNKY